MFVAFNLQSIKWNDLRSDNLYFLDRDLNFFFFFWDSECSNKQHNKYCSSWWVLSSIPFSLSEQFTNIPNNIILQNQFYEPFVFLNKIYCLVIRLLWHKFTLLIYFSVSSYCLYSSTDVFLLVFFSFYIIVYSFRISFWPFASSFIHRIIKLFKF